MAGCLWQTVSQGILETINSGTEVGRYKNFFLLKGAQKSVQNHREKKLYCLFQLPCVSVLGYRSNPEVLTEGWIVPPKLYLPLVG